MFKNLTVVALLALVSFSFPGFTVSSSNFQFRNKNFYLPGYMKSMDPSASPFPKTFSMIQNETQEPKQAKENLTFKVGDKLYDVPKDMALNIYNQYTHLKINKSVPKVNEDGLIEISRAPEDKGSDDLKKLIEMIFFESEPKTTGPGLLKYVGADAQVEEISNEDDKKINKNKNETETDKIIEDPPKAGISLAQSELESSSSSYSALFYGSILGSVFVVAAVIFGLIYRRMNSKISSETTEEALV